MSLVDILTLKNKAQQAAITQYVNNNTVYPFISNDCILSYDASKAQNGAYTPLNSDPNTPTSIWFDKSKSSHNGTLTGFVYDGKDRWDYDRNGYYLQEFNSAVNVDCANVLNGLQDFTITIKLKRNVNNQNQEIFGSQLLASENGVMMKIRSTNVLWFSIGDNVNNHIIMSTTTLAVQTPIVITIRRAGTKINIFINNVNTDNFTLTKANTLTPIIMSLFKLFNANSTEHFDGRIYNFMVYKRALTDAENTVNYNILNSAAINTNDWVGKKYNALGDSVTFLHLYTDRISNTMWMTCNNYGVSSTTVAVNNTYVTGQSFVERLGSMDNTADLVIIQGGLNDWLYLTPIGDITSTDTSTFYGALKNLYSTIHTNIPNAKIVYLTPHQSNRNGANTNGITMPTFCQAIKDVGALYGCLVIDLYNESGITAVNLATYTTDSVHPNGGGALLISNLITSKLKTI